jgi:hypothetical protein
MYYADVSVVLMRGRIKWVLDAWLRERGYELHEYDATKAVARLSMPVHEIAWLSHRKLVSYVRVNFTYTKAA